MSSFEESLHFGIVPPGIGEWQMEVLYKEQPKGWLWTITRPKGLGDAWEVDGRGFSRSYDLAVQEAKIAWWQAGAKKRET